MKMESFTFCRTVLIFFMFPCVQVMKAVWTEFYFYSTFIQSSPSLGHKNMEPIRAEKVRVQTRCAHSL